MKKNVVFLLVFVTGIALAENTLIAVVNNAPISLHSIKDSFLLAKTKEEEIEILNAEIDLTLQLQKVSEYGLKPSTEEVQEVLIDVAKNNKIALDDLLNFDEIDSIINEIVEKLSILNLQRFITMKLEKPTKKILNRCSNINSEKDEKQIKIAQIIISEIDSDLKDPEQQNRLIQSFLNKLSTHISKGASFESFAKLHSQHPSYKDGGVTDWLTVNNPTLEMLDSLKTNEVSEIYSTIYGLAIAIKIDERFISSKLKECEEKIIYQNADIYYMEWLKDLRERAFIEIYYDKLK
jgi:peptidyl-prolyl cis-trans isomerase SurA